MPPDQPAGRIETPVFSKEPQILWKSPPHRIKLVVLRKLWVHFLDHPPKGRRRCHAAACGNKKQDQSHDEPKCHSPPPNGPELSGERGKTERVRRSAVSFDGSLGMPEEAIRHTGKKDEECDNR